MEPDFKPKIAQTVAKVSERNLSRGEFLAYGFGSILALTGIGGIIETLKGQHKLTSSAVDLSSFETKANKNQPGGYAGLNSQGLIPTALLPVTTTSTPAATPSTPTTPAVTSVNSQTGAIALTAASLGALVATANLNDLPSKTTARTNLGLGTASQHASTDFDAAGTADTVQTNLTSEVSRAKAAEGTLTTNLTTEATTRSTADTTLTTNLASEVSRATAAEGTLTTNVATNASAIATETTRAEAAEGTLLVKANNLSDLSSASTARTNLGLGTAATHDSTDFDAAGSAATVQTNLNSEASTARAAELAASSKSIALSIVFGV